MKKAVVVILAVAIIGALGVYGKSQSKPAQAGGPNSASSNNPASYSQNANSAAFGSASSNLRDGTYTGASEDTPYGTVQIAIEVSGGQISNINFLQMPSDLPHSQEVTAVSEPLLKQETLQNQSAHIDFISGATSTSEGYIQSLQSALNQAAMS